MQSVTEVRPGTDYPVKAEENSMFVAIVLVQLLAASQHVEAVTTSNLGNGTVYTLQVVQDVSLERNTRNYNYLPYLLVGLHQGYPRKRSLLQFEDLPTNCTTIHWAKMYLYYVYSHKASFQSVQQAPFISRNIQVHVVKKEWEETQATRTYRKTGVPWSQPYLALNGSDAKKKVLDSVTIYTGRPRGFVEFDITKAIRRWKRGRPNYGVVIRASNEDTLGRDTRFASNANSDSTTHAYVNVLCS